MMDAASTRSNTPEGRYLYVRRRENLKYHQHKRRQKNASAPSKIRTSDFSVLA
jgi:hypothetical protein